MKKILTFVFLLPVLFAYSQTTMTANLDFSDTDMISPLIYGYNQDHESPDGDENWTIRRLGGNRMSSFNWENGASNGDHNSNNRIPSLLGIPWSDKDAAGEAYRFFHEENTNSGLTSIVTVPIQGWVAADKDGIVTTAPPSARWDSLVYEKPTAFNTIPDLNDGIVYLDESVNFFVNELGTANNGGIKYVSLDNEPSLWDNTHDLIQPNPVKVEDYVNKVIAAAKAVKSIDPNIKIIGGEFAFLGIFDLQNAPDWDTEGAGYDWFIDYFLDKMKAASDAEGYNLIDILSFHAYPKHKIDENGNYSNTGVTVRHSTSTADHIRSARMSFPRSLWDATYLEPSKFTFNELNGEEMKLLVRLQNSIDTYFPGTKLMIGEYDYGHDQDISHGIGIADFLAVVANQGVEIVTRWDTEPYNSGNYTSTAYQLFRNYDGNNGQYGNQSIASTFNQKDKGSVWAATDTDDGDLHLIITNKQINDDLTLNLNLNDAANVQHSFGDLWKFDNQSTALIQGSQNDITIGDDGTLAATLSPLTVYHLIIKRTECSEYTLEDWDVESGFSNSIWSDGGADCFLDNNANYASSGTRSVRLQDDESGSKTTTSVLDLSNYVNLTIDFNYYAWSFDNSAEDFWFQISLDGGATYTTVEDWVYGLDFNNDEFKTGQVYLSNEDYNLTSEVRLRFRCDASGNADRVYIDDIKVSGCAFPPSNAANTNDPSSTIPTKDITVLDVFPNPFNDQIMVKTDAEEVFIFDSLGRLIKTVKLPKNTENVEIETSDFPKGTYFIQAGNKVLKLVK